MKECFLCFLLSALLTGCSHDTVWDDANDFAFRLVDQNGKDLISDLNVSINEILMTTADGDVLKLVRKHTTDNYLTTIPLLPQPDYIISCRSRSVRIRINFSYDYLNKNSPPSWTIQSVGSSNGTVTVEHGHQDNYVYVIPI